VGRAAMRSINVSEGDPRTRWARVIVGANAMGFLAIGAVALLWPHTFGSFTGGIVLTTAPAVTDFRAVYGGLHLAIAVALFAWVASRPLTRPCLFLALLAVSGLAFGRVWGMVANGRADQLSLGLLAPEVLGVALNGALWWWSGRLAQRP